MQSLYNSTKTDDGYVFVPQRAGTHLIINNDGTIKRDTFLVAPNNPTWFTSYVQGGLVTAINIKRIIPGYDNWIVFQKGQNGEQNAFRFTFGIPNTATVNNNRLYIQYSIIDVEGDERPPGIYVYDLITNKEIDNIAISNPSLYPAGKHHPLKIAGDYLLLSGDSSILPIPQIYPPCLGVIDTKSDLSPCYSPLHSKVFSVL